MATVVPSLREQRSRALDRANESRHRPLEFRASMRSVSYRRAVLEAARVLVEDREMVGPMRVYKMLEAVPTLGVRKTMVILNRHRIYAAKPVRDLTDRQATLLAGELVRRAARMGKA